MAQSPAPAAGVAGKFYVIVDDNARIFVNGQMVHSGGIGTSVSRETSLKPGDRVVAQLHESGGGKKFKLLFVSSDQKTIIPFLRLSFRVLNDFSTTDFTPADWAKMGKYAKGLQVNVKDGFPIKNNADWVWGEENDCALGSLLTVEMFKTVATPAGGGVAAKGDAAAPLLTIESYVDGPSSLFVRRDGIYWVNGNNAKPGLGKRPTYVNGAEWMPKWGVPGQERGFDRSDVFPVSLGTLEVSVELVSNMKERDVEAVDPSRSPIKVQKRANEIEVVIPDPESGQRWYKLVLRGRKR